MCRRYRRVLPSVESRCTSRRVCGSPSLIGISNVESKMNDVAVFHNVILAFELVLSMFPATRFAAVLDQVFEPDHFCPDKAALDIRVNLAGRFMRRGPAPDRPRAALIFARREKADQIQQRVHRSYETVSRGFGNPEIDQEVALLGWIKLSNIHLGLAAHLNQVEMICRGGCADIAGNISRYPILTDAEQKLERFKT